MFARFLAVLIAAAATTTAARAAWPERPVTLIVPFAPGGITDTLARITAARLQSALGQPFIVENQAGAAGLVATERVARARPDGYTILFSTITQIAIAPFTNKIAYDPIKDFKPVSIVATSPFILTTGVDFPAKTLPDFISYVKAHAGQFTYGTAGSGSLSHISAAVFLKARRPRYDHGAISRSGACLHRSAWGGNVQMVSATPVELLPYMHSNAVRLLASSGATRSASCPTFRRSRRQFRATKSSPGMAFWLRHRRPKP